MGTWIRKQIALTLLSSFCDSDPIESETFLWQPIRISLSIEILIRSRCLRVLLGGEKELSSSTKEK
jgi:hypothetical protein